VLQINFHSSVQEKKPLIWQTF